MHEWIVNIAISSTGVVAINTPSSIVDEMAVVDSIGVKQVGLVSQDL
jgi:hypothetical protein